VTKKIIKPAQMQLGDIVRLNDTTMSFGASLVREITKDGQVKLFRPYATCSDFSTTSGVIPYIGIEDWEFSVTDERSTFELLERRAVP